MIQQKQPALQPYKGENLSSHQFQFHVMLYILNAFKQRDLYDSDELIRAMV